MRGTQTILAAMALGAATSVHAQESEGGCRPLQLADDTTDTRAGGASHTWAQANGSARQRAERHGFSAARYVYTYAPGALYELLTHPNFISTILLEDGEALVDVAAGDTSRWSVTQAVTSGAFGPRTILLVKPQAPGLRTNIVLVTDRRTYLIEALSHARDAYSAEIAWCYPSPSTDGGGVSALNFAYRTRVVRGRRPAWAPERIFDDGRRTWIEFNNAIAASDMPPLFVISSEGPELVNYRVDGARYVVDRVFDVAELRLGVRTQTIVRIERENAAVSRAVRTGRP